MVRRAGLAGIAVAALAVRVAGLGEHTPWFDELLELGRAALPLAERLAGRPIDQDPPLYALFLGAWQAVAGPGDAWWPRLPSALAGTAAVALSGAWAARLAGRRAGGLTALLVALSPLHVHYAREINQYAFVALLSVALLVAWEAVRRAEASVGGKGARGRTRGPSVASPSQAWLVLGGLSLGALGTHYGMAFPLAVVGLDLGLRARASGRWRPWLGWSAAVALELAVLLALGLGDRIDIGHVQKRFGGTDLAKELGYIADVGWRDVLVFTFFPFAGGVALPIVRALTALAAVGAAVLWARSGAGRRAAGGWLGGTLAMTYVASLFGLYPLGFRHGLFNAPVWTMLVAAGIAAAGEGAGRLARRAARAPSAPSRTAAVVRTVLAASVAGAFLAFSPLERWDNPHLSVPREDLGPALEAALARRRPDEALYVYHGAELAARFLAPGLAQDRAVAWGRPFDSRDAAAASSEAARIAALAPPTGGVWTVWTHVHPADRAALTTALLRDAGLVAVERALAPGALAERYAAPPAEGSRSP